MNKKNVCEPKHQALTEHYRQAILSGKINPGERLPADEVLAKEYSVNKRTVAAGLSKLVAEGLISRAPGRGTIVIRQNIIKRKNDVVGCIAPCYGEVFSTMEEAITDQILRKGFYPMWVSKSLYHNAVSTPNHPNFFQFTERFINDMPYGLIIHGERFMPYDLIERNRAKIERLVFICDYIHSKQLKAKYVLIDYKTAAKKAIRHLVRNGHRKVTFITPQQKLPGITPQFIYHTALQEACRKYGMEYDAEIPERLWRGSDPVSVLRMLKHRKITAAMLPFDAMLVQYRNAFRTARIRIPDDLSIIGFYDTVNCLSDQITTLNIQERKIAHYATEMLFEEDDNIHEILIEPQLIERNTVISI